jgi:folate-binding protein YgfZ
VSSSVAREVAAVRSGVGVFFATGQSGRGLVEVTGGDARRWLDGMLSNDVTTLEAGGEHSGCHALLLTPKGRIVADLQVLAREAGFWLEMSLAVVAGVLARLDHYIVADDVKLSDRSAEIERLGVEGPGAEEVLTRAVAGGPGSLAVDACCEIEIAGAPIVVARFGWSGEDGFQLFLPKGSRDRVLEALRAASPGSELALVGREAFEILRIEAGIPWQGAELDEEVLPDEARLERAISRTKGCYTGQEIVARVHSRGAVNHLLVGLHFEGDGSPPPVETPLQVDERRTGEVTSVCVSPGIGAIGLGYVRREHARPDTELRAGSVTARVSELPFVQPEETRRA